MYQTTTSWNKPGRNQRSPFEWERFRKRNLDRGNLGLVAASYKIQHTFLVDSNTSNFWDTFSKKEEQLLFPMEKWRNAVVAGMINPKLSMLNIGVGQGILEQELAKRGKLNPHTYLGTDITISALATLKATFPQLQFEQKTFAQLAQLWKGRFDQVILLEVIEHIPPHTTFFVLQTLASLLKKSGMCIISVPLNEGLEKMYPRNPNSHQRVYSESLLRFELQKVGFRVVRRYQASAFKSGFWWKHFLNRFFHSKHPNTIVMVCQKK